MKFEVVDFPINKRMGARNAAVDDLVSTLRGLPPGKGVMVTAEMFGWKADASSFRSRLFTAFSSRRIAIVTTSTDGGESIIIRLREERGTGGHE